MTKNSSGPKISLSFRENVRDIELYNFLTTEIKNEYGISFYIKKLIEDDMNKKNKERK